MEHTVEKEGCWHVLFAAVLLDAPSAGLLLGPAHTPFSASVGLICPCLRARQVPMSTRQFAFYLDAWVGLRKGLV